VLVTFACLVEPAEEIEVLTEVVDPDEHLDVIALMLGSPGSCCDTCMWGEGESRYIEDHGVRS
jgi:hypothetical protein